MGTYHRVFYKPIHDCRIKYESIDLIVTSPPYPMIEMWDDQFIDSNIAIKNCLEYKGKEAHFLMLKSLSRIWHYCSKVLKPGGFLCINIGDATRRINGSFRLYDNHSPIALEIESYGLEQLPRIIWRKQTNSPNKFMGSGTLPLRAYITLEHEYILIFRKGEAVISQEREERRRHSSIFWEERNKWFSDLWEFKGTTQTKNGNRTAAFPFELAHRLINMFSVQGDIVVDPFLGTGTTMSAAIVNGRSSIGCEINPNLKPIIISTLKTAKKLGREIPLQRVRDHKNISMSYSNGYTSSYGPVKTRQEINIKIPLLKSFRVKRKNNYKCEYTFLK